MSLITGNDENMKIIFVGNYWPYIDGGTRIARLVPILIERGYQVHIFTMPLRETPKSFPNLHIHEVSFAGDTFHVFRRILNRLYKIKSSNLHNGLKEKIVGSKDSSFSFLSILLNRLFKLYDEIFSYPDAYKSWQTNLYDALCDYLDGEANNCIIISEYPTISHVVSKKIKKKYAVPWVADFVDLWSENHNYPYSKVRKFFDRKLERSTLRHANYIVTTSNLWAEKLRKLHFGKSVLAIPHGFDATIYEENLSNKVADREKTLKNGTFDILYAGRLYSEMQDISLFFDALYVVQTQEPDIELRVTFYSPDKASIVDAAKKSNVSKLISVKDVVSRAEIMQLMLKYDLMLAVGVDTKSGLTGSIPSKLYDYITMHKPVLLAGGVAGDEADQMLIETKIGVSVTSVADCVIALENFVLAHKSGSNFLAGVNGANLRSYSSHSTADKFENIIKSCKTEDLSGK